MCWTEVHIREGPHLYEHEREGGVGPTRAGQGSATGETHFEMSMSGRAECPGSLEKSLLSMAAQKPSHSRTKLLLAMPPGMAMSLNRSLWECPTLNPSLIWQPA